MSLRTTREFSALCDWLLHYGVSAPAMEGTGIFWKAPYKALEDTDIAVELFHAQHVRQIKGRKTDKNEELVEQALRGRG